jgi:hypothetical protein
VVLLVCHFLADIGFVEAKSDTSLLIYHHTNGIAYLLYVDDIVLTASNPPADYLHSAAGVCYEGSRYTSPLLGCDS